MGRETITPFAGVTDALHALAALARVRDPRYRDDLDALVARHVAAARDLLPPAEAVRLEAVFHADGRDLADVLRAVWLARSCPEATVELVAGYGELWSAQLLHAYLHSEGDDARWLDARAVLVVGAGPMGVEVDWDVSRAKLDAWRRENPSACVVVTGYIAATAEGVPTTLKRNGSDFSAPSSAPSSTPPPCTSGPTSTGCSRPIPGACPRPCARRDELRRGRRARVFRRQGAAPPHHGARRGAAIPIYIRNTFNPTHRARASTAAERLGDTRGAPWRASPPSTASPS
jgi:aspartokinase/homoserine dehydrogenase 1